MDLQLIYLVSFGLIYWIEYVAINYTSSPLPGVRAGDDMLMRTLVSCEISASESLVAKNPDVMSY